MKTEKELKTINTNFYSLVSQKQLKVPAIPVTEENNSQANLILSSISTDKTVTPTASVHAVMTHTSGG